MLCTCKALSHPLSGERVALIVLIEALVALLSVDEGGEQSLRLFPATLAEEIGTLARAILSIDSVDLDL